MDRIKERDYPVFKFSEIASVGKVGMTLDREPRMVEYYRYISVKDGRKVYYFADTTMRRLDNMDLSKMGHEDLLSICKKEQGGHGFVLTSENHRRLCFGYVIRENHILIAAYRPNKSAQKSDNPDSVMESMVIGNIIISEDGVTWNPSTTLTGLVNYARASYQKNAFDKTDLPTVRRILREVKECPDAFRNPDAPGTVNFDIKKLAEDERVPYTRREAQSYLYKLSILDTVLRMFVFLKTASVIEQTYISDNEPVRSYERGKGVIRNFVLVDSTWDGDITVLNPFSVRGHFRHQPKKDENGEWYRDLIYIDAFMKKGYHRRATKVIDEKP
jgi:hypothetical protein